MASKVALGTRANASRSRDETCHYKAPETNKLTSYHARLVDLVPPAALWHQHSGVARIMASLGGGGSLLEALYTQADMANIFQDGNKCLELGLLANKHLPLHSQNMGFLLEKASDLHTS